MANQLANALCERWREKLRLGRESKERDFGKDARDCMRFYGESHDFLYSFEYNSRTAGSPTVSTRWRTPTHQMTANLVSNGVQIFLPVLYHKNPQRLVTPAKAKVDPEAIAALEAALAPPPPPPMPQGQLPPGMMPPGMEGMMGGGMPPEMMGGQMGGMMGNGQMGMMPQQPQQPPQDPYEAICNARAALMQGLLNATPFPTDLKRHSRRALTEGLVKGRAILMAGFVNTPLGRMPCSTYESVDDFVTDPDATEISDSMWCAFRRWEPVWWVEKKFGLPKGKLKGTGESYEQQAQTNLSDDLKQDRRTGETNDMIEYWEVYSRMGVGHRLKGSTDDKWKAIAAAMTEEDNVYLAIAPTEAFPLNLPEYLFEEEFTPDIQMEIEDRLKWSIETHYREAWPWPFAILDFHEMPGKSWPQGHFFPTMGYQKAIDWIYSYLIGRIRVACRTLIGVPKGGIIDQEALNIIMYGSDLETFEMSVRAPDKMADLLHYLQIPDVSKDVFSVLIAIKKEWEDGTGVTELQLSGNQPKQMRSAQEAGLKEKMLSVRPDDMSNQVDDWMSMAAANEAIAALQLEPGEIAAIFGEEYDDTPIPMGELGMTMPPRMGRLTKLWFDHVHSQGPEKIAAGFEFRIEAGSARKPNKESAQAEAQENLQVMMPLLMQYYMQTGDPGPINAMLRQWAKAFDHKDIEDMLLPDRQQQMAEMAQAQMQGQQQAEMAKVEAEQKKGEIETQFQERKLQREDVAHQQKMAQSQQKHEMGLQQQQDKALMDLQTQMMAMQGMGGGMGMGGMPGAPQ